jgi:hypothetical protein
MKTLAFIVVAPGAAFAQSGSPAEKSPVPYPHPLITEVLYDVPKGPAGDANGDGQRSANGDEFVELINPHDKAINLRGYTITDAKKGEGKGEGAGGGTGGGDQPAAPAPDKQDHAKKPAGEHRKSAGGGGGAALKFTFPNLELGPGQVVVVFNGYQQTFRGPVGTATAAPTGPNEHFHNAMVFTMNVQSQFVAFANAGDCVVLRDPDGKVVECITWGKPEKGGKVVPTGALLTEQAPESGGSVQRASLGGKFVPHKEMKGDLAGELFSPGRFDLVPAAAPAAKTPVKPEIGPGAPPKPKKGG